MKDPRSRDRDTSPSPHKDRLQKLLAEQMPAVLWSTDSELRFTSWSGAGLASRGLGPAPPMGMSLDEFFGTQDPAALPIAAHHQALRGESVAYEGAWFGRAFQVRVEPLRDRDGSVRGTIAAALDITERKQVEIALRDSEERYRLLFERNLAGVFRSTVDGRILDCNDACWRMFGCGSREEFLTRSAPSFYADPAEREMLVARLREHGSVSGEELRLRSSDGSDLWVIENLTLAHDPGGSDPVIVGCIVDITERKRAEDRIVYQGYHDALTGLPNRSLFTDRLSVALSHARRVGGRLAVLHVDLDHFQRFNDTLGHRLGDELLEEVARRILLCARQEETVSRSGGDEFSILAPHPAADEASLRLAREILDEVARPIRIGEHELYVTASIGIAVFPEDGDDGETLLKNADNAMHRAKELAPNGIQLFTPAMNRRAFERLDVENGLRHAIAKRELRVHYQPFYDAETVRPAGVEALLRWNRPGIGLVRPEDFVAVAEETGLILPIGEWILDEACRQLRQWQEAGLHSLRLAVNLSMRQFREPALAESIERILGRHGISPDCLEIEITESIAMQDAELTLATLGRIRSAGIGIALDDFGTGHASLNHLKRFPITRLKIDRSFVSDMLLKPENAAIVRTIIAMAHDLHLRVIAEGVESAEQLARLRAFGCDDIQGYWLAGPLPAEECEAALSGALSPSGGGEAGGAAPGRSGRFS